MSAAPYPIRDKDRRMLAEMQATQNPAMTAMLSRARLAAAVDTPILIRGETGTGKERLATAIHLWSARPEGPLVKINCAAIPPNLLESELFGHVRGAFTGARTDRDGRFKSAHGGTMMLDEIGEMSPDLQAKMLRVLQEGEINPVGSDRPLQVDVRIVAATHVDLELAVKEGRFRADLYYRLNVFSLNIPPLRARLDELEALCDAVLTDLCTRYQREPVRIAAGYLDQLRGHAWPGNVRELTNVLERALILSEGRELRPQILIPGEPLPPPPPPPNPLFDDEILTLAEVERRYIQRVLHHAGGKIYGDNGAAQLLGLKPTTLHSRMKKLGVQKP